MEENLVRQFDLSRRYDNIQSISYRCYASVERLTQKIFVEDDTDGIFFDGIDGKEVRENEKRIKKFKLDMS